MARILDETLIVDVSKTDGSDHPGWEQDFEASRLECKPEKYSDLLECIHPREVVAIRRIRMKGRGGKKRQESRCGEGVRSEEE